MFLLTSLFWVLLFCYPSIGATAKKYYVKPIGPTAECPPDGTPCHSLQYYANHSTFTSNSEFLFLEGEHHLDSVVEIANVTDLSLVGASLRLEILCTSLPSGFHVTHFADLSFKNLTLVNCTGYEMATVYLDSGSDVVLNQVAIINNSGYHATGLVALDVAGQFSVFNSIFHEEQGNNMLVNYSAVVGPSRFNFSNNTLGCNRGSYSGLILQISCSNVDVIVADSILRFGSWGLNISFTTLMDNFVLVDKFNGTAHITVSESSFVAGEAIKESNNSSILIQNTTFSSKLVSALTFVVTTSGGGIVRPYWLPQMTLRNVVFDNRHFYAALFNRVTVWIINCTFKENNYGTLQASYSRLIFQGNTTFRNNWAYEGAGIRLLSGSYMHLKPDTHILFAGNQAGRLGGAIYSDSKDSCFFEADEAPFNSITVTFVNNTAGTAGSSLYGGLSNCCITTPDDCLDCEVFYRLFHISNSEADPSAIASDPYLACSCEEDKHQPNCTGPASYHNKWVYPGQKFTVRLAVVGGPGIHGIVPGVITAYYNYNNIAVKQAQHYQTSSCSDLSYSVNFFAQNTTIVTLSAEQSIISLASSVAVYVYFIECPTGFPLSTAERKCVCDPAVRGYDIECLITHYNFFRSADSTTWIGFINSSSKPGVMLHPNCPKGYCSPNSVTIASNNSDSQCESHRIGLLCGRCEEGYSITLGRQQCEECSNVFLFLLVPMALAGIFLVVILFALNLTVASGTINGLVFYANIVGMNPHNIALFSREANYLYLLLSWINLDLGIKTCLFDGLDGYAEIWLQFIFPCYLWTICLVIIRFYNRFPTLANRMGGKNAVSVLATIMLLSYTKLQRTVVTIMSFTTIKYPNGTVQYVWLYDANVEFFKGKHLFLGVAGILVLVFLIVPYTLCLAFFQQLQACSGRRFFQWVNKLKPVFDAYAGPYKDKYRFWTGLLLVVRTLLIILFTSNTAQSIDLDLLIVLIVSLALLLANTSGAYAKWHSNYLEAFFYLQLAVFAAGVTYARHTHGNIAAVADTSFALTLVVFLVMVGYQLVRHLASFRRFYYNRYGYADDAEKEMSINFDRE